MLAHLETGGKTSYPYYFWYSHNVGVVARIIES